MGDRSKKVKTNLVDKTHLWNVFDSEINGEKTPLECIYRESRDREECDQCKSALAFFG